MGMRYDDSPVGRYLELSVAEPVRLGLRTGLCVVTMAVTSPRARALSRERWDFPTEVAALRWEADGDQQALIWEERGIEVRARPWGPWMPAVVPYRSLQCGPGEPVVVPRRLGARVRMAGVEIDVGETDALAALRGHHAGAVMAGVRMVTRPARRPAGLLSSIPVPVRPAIRGPEPAGMAATMAGPGRMAQLVRAQPSHG